ncbi:AfsA-related hotdog domain-containing protein [Streptomyces sp. NPDC057362]|uniref:AfsA-related hotdog domain-containing protein n=1 Tax=Streptomyces sp. NPDC057362 TaxID=3346106 RepID=UPI00363324E1
MATAVSAFSAISALRFDRTVPLELVHRRSLSEVFLTDSRAVGEAGFVAAAQVPAFHAHRTECPSGSTIDALLLLECCRQAETHAAHKHFNVPDDAGSVVRSWAFSFPGPAGRAPLHGPADVVIMAETCEGRQAGQFLRALCYRMHVIESGRYVGEIRMDTAYLPGRAYRAASAQHRGAGLFERPRGPVPGIALMDAGRQAALAVVKAAVPTAAAWRLTALDADFERYVEPDSSLAVVTHPPRRGVTGRDIRVPVTFEQYDRVSARATLTLTRAHL